MWPSADVQEALLRSWLMYAARSSAVYGGGGHPEGFRTARVTRAGRRVPAVEGGDGYSEDRGDIVRAQEGSEVWLLV